MTRLSSAVHATFSLLTSAATALVVAEAPGWWLRPGFAESCRLLPLLGLAAWLATTPAAHAQVRPYLGYAYPAGGQQCTTVQIRLGGQNLDDIESLLVTGEGVSARVVEYLRRLNNQEIQLLNEQLRELKRTGPAPAAANAKAGAAAPAPAAIDAPPQELIARIERRVREWVQTPACASISSIVLAEITVSPDAEPGPREIRLVTARGVSNPLAFHVGQFFEQARKPMATATIQILGKEAQALRKRPASEAEVRITLPCTVNGQIASGEVNTYRFSASKGQRLVIAVQARQLIPFIADAVPGWFQPVLAVYDAQGRELAFADDYRFQPDPVILFPVPADGEYVFAIRDAIYRGREDFVYRITAGELPFVTSIFPLGGQAGAGVSPEASGWNVRDAELCTVDRDPYRGTELLAASRMGFESNRVPFALDRLPDVIEQESNDTIATAQPISLPAIINGRIDRPDDRDVFGFTGKANDSIVVEVYARRLDSPLDSVVKLTNAAGKVVAFNDDREDPGAGLNTHHADSYLMAKLPADGRYFVHLADTARQGGSEYGYRLRISAPQPDFELRISPSSLSLRTNSTSGFTVYAARKDGFTGPIRLTLKDPPPGFAGAPVTIPANQTQARFNLRSPAVPTRDPVKLTIAGSAKIGSAEVSHDAVPAEDRMQAFLWRHLVPARDLCVTVFDPNYQPPPKRVVPVMPPRAATPAVETVAATAIATNGTTNTPTPPKPAFTKQQIAGRLRQLKLLYEEGLLNDGFYLKKVAECEEAK